MMTQWMTLQEAAAYLRLSRDATYKLAQRGRVPAYKLGRQWRFDPDALEQWVRRARPIGPTIPQRVPLHALLATLRAQLAALYGDRLRGLFLYGSYARGDADAESDVDLLVVLNQVTRYAAEVDRTGPIGAALSLQYGVSISLVFVSESAWRRTKSPFLMNVHDEARAA